MSTHQVHVFISHSWAYSGHYETIRSWIFDSNHSLDQASVYFQNFSVPKDNPIHNANNDKQLRDAIFNQIRRCHVVVIPTGMYVNYSKWIQKEIDGAKNYNKPILAVNPRGQQRTSSVVVSNCDEHVGWTQKSVVKGIWYLYYG